jgi:hypothetical protein
VVGNRVELEDGTYCSEQVSQKKISEIYGIPLPTINARAGRERWNDLRKAYLMKVSEKNIGKDLNLYAESQNISEINALTAVEKLGKVLGTYIDTRYSLILEATEQGDTVELNEDLRVELGRVNQNTGIPVFINELSNAVKVTRDIYELSRKIYDNSPNSVDIDVVTSDKELKFKNDNERETKLAQLKRRLALSEESSKALKKEEKEGQEERVSPYRTNAVVEVKAYTST